MRGEVDYGPRERFWLWTLAVFGFFVLNGAFVYAVLRPGVLAEAMTNPVALVFVGEALLLVGVMSYLLTKWHVSRLAWPWFVLLSLLGGMAFALPIVVLWPKRRLPADTP